jgi:hypothetical protein
MIHSIDSFLSLFLLPCPFCASTELTAIPADEWWQIECAVCRALGPVTNEEVFALEDSTKAVDEDAPLEDGEDSSLISGPVGAALLWNIRNGPAWQFEERMKELKWGKLPEERVGEAPCPFCGSIAIEEEGGYIGHGCGRCGAFGPSQWDFKDLEGKETPEILWKFWRTRQTTHDRKD